MNSKTAFRRIVKGSSSPYRLKNLNCSNHTATSSQKQIAKAKNPRMVASNSSKVLGTSRDTTSSVSAKAKTASAKPSIRETSWPRQEKPSSPPIRLWANLLRSTISVHQLPTSPKLLWAGFNATLAAEVTATESYEGAARCTFSPLSATKHASQRAL